MEEPRKARSDSEPTRSGFADRLRSSSGSVPAPASGAPAASPLTERLRSSSGSIPAPPLDDEDVGSRLRALASADTTELERLAQRKRAGSIRPHAGRAALGLVGAVLWTLDMLRRGLVAFSRSARVALLAFARSARVALLAFVRAASAVLRACGVGLRKASRGVLNAALSGARALRRTSSRTSTSTQAATAALGSTLRTRGRTLAIVTASCASLLAVGYAAVKLAPRGGAETTNSARHNEAGMTQADVTQAGMTQASASTGLLEDLGMRIGAATHRSIESLSAAEPEPAPAPPVHSKYVLEVRTEPPGATVRTDHAGSLPFTTPGRLELDHKPGVLFVGVQKSGHRPVELRINGTMFEAKGDRRYHRVELTLEPLQRARRPRK